MKDSVIIQSYGSEAEYKRAIFSIWSFYAYVKLPIEQTQVILFTDHPDYFSVYLKELPVKYILLTPEKLKNMRGKIDFVHRVKIAAIDESFNYCSGNLLYIDSDTFFIDDATPILKRISANHTFMHKNEYQLKELKSLKLPAGETFHIWYDYVMSKSFQLTDGTTIQISPNQSSWNAGVIILHLSHRALLRDVYSLTDDFFPHTQNVGCEQYAFSIVLERNTSVEPCENFVYHYWLPIKKKIVDLFLDTRITLTWANQTLSEKGRIIKEWSLVLPNFIENHVYMIQYKAIQAFHDDKFLKGYAFALKALAKRPLFLNFYSEIGYHVKRNLKFIFR